MVVRYVTIFDRENPENPDGKNVANELERVISEIERSERVKFVSACFIERKDVPKLSSNPKDDETFNKVECYQLFFR